MTATIKSGATSDLLGIDTSKAGRITLYDSTGALINTSNPLQSTIGSLITNSVPFYSAIIKGATPFTSTANPWIILQNNPPKVTKIVRILYSSTEVTGGGVNGQAWIGKFSSANPITNAFTIVQASKPDSNDPNPTALVLINGGGFTGVLISNESSIFYGGRYIMTTVAATGPLPFLEDFSFAPFQSMFQMVLRDNEIFGLGLDGAGTTITSDVSIYWTEE